MGDEVKKENYQLTIYKLNEYIVLSQLRERIKQKIVHPKEIKNHGVMEVDDNTKILYVSFINKNPDSEITWFRKWDQFFEIKDELRSSTFTGHGAIIIELIKEQKQYLLTFGKSASLFKDIIVPNYGIDIAGRLFTGKTMDSVSSKFFSMTKNKTLTSYAQGTLHDFEEGEAADLIKAKLEEHSNRKEDKYIEQLLTYVKPLATISYSNVKLTVCKEDICIKDIVEVIRLMDKIESSYSYKLDIPQMKPIPKDQETKLNEKLWNSIKAKDNSVVFSVPIFAKDNDDFYYFLDAIDSVTLKYGRYASETYENFCLDDLFSFVDNNPEIESLNQIRCIISVNQINQKIEISKWLEAQIEDENVTYALYNGRWYSFNDNYLKRITNKIVEIENEGKVLSVDNHYSVSSEVLNRFCESHSDEIERLFSKEGNTPLTKIYTEFKYNFYTAKHEKWNLFDRCLSENVELCDLCDPNNSFIHCKIGETENLEECLRQSILSLLYFTQKQPNIERFTNKEGKELTKPQFIKVLYLLKKETASNFKISKLQSLKCKLTFLHWYKQCILMQYKPQLIIATYT